MHRFGKFSGFTLLEVLIALLIFSLGLLGMAGLLVVSVQANHSAFLRTQATFLSQSIADRMRANIPRVWAGDYSKTYPTSDTDPCLSSAACTNANIATRDRAIFSDQLKFLLPNATATMACAPGSVVTVSPEAQAQGAPYPGVCKLNISWSESTLDRTAGATPVTQTFAWAFTP